MIEITNLTKSYSKGNVPAVKNLSLKINDGEIFGFIGPNGAGKSTTIKCITGILDFEEGNIQIDNINLKSSPIEAKKLIGYVSDDHEMYDRLTGLEYINFMANIFDIEKSLVDKRLKKYLDMFELNESINNQIKSYSHGMKQKLNIIGALIHEPKVWILDEPMTGLDPKSAYNLKKLMKEYANEGHCVFFSSHVLDIVEKVCDRVAIIDKGTLITDCTVQELHNTCLTKSLEELFLQITATDDEKIE